MREIPTTSGNVILVDDADYEAVSQHRWQAMGGGLLYPYRHIPGQRGKTISLANELLSPPKGMFVDHINNNPWDNRRCNLRLCTHQQNMFNRRTCRPESFRGVFACGKRWKAQIVRNQRSFYLGLFDTPEDAARAYDAAARRLHGEFARLNFPEQSPNSSRVPLSPGRRDGEMVPNLSTRRPTLSGGVA